LPLAALIAAQESLESGEGLRATLPVAGRTLIEYQVGAVVAAGVTRIVLLVERVPAALAQAMDRLRRDGVQIEAARSVSDAADRFHPDDRILLVADGCVAGRTAIDRLVKTPAPALLALPDTTEQAMFERIDPETRWAGYALITGASLHDTNRMLGDWELTSTQLRRSVQEGATRVDALAPSIGGEAGMQPIIAIGRGSLVTLERGLLHRPPAMGGDWVDRYLHRLIAAPLVGPLIGRRVQPLHIALGSAGLAWIGALGAVFGYFWAAAILLPIATAAFAVARQMARIWSADVPEARWIIVARQAAALLALAMLAYSLNRQGGWGWWGVAAIVPLGLTGLSALRPVARVIEVTELPLWLPRSDSLIWMAPLLAILAGWAWMMVVLAAYCGVGFGWLLRLVRQGAMQKGPGVTPAP
jgi:hypothetical protein